MMGDIAEIPIITHDPDFGCERCPALREDDLHCVSLRRRMSRMELWDYAPASCPLRSGPLMVNVEPDPTCLPVQPRSRTGTSGGTSDADEPKGDR